MTRELTDLQNAAEKLWLACSEFMSDRCTVCQSGKDCPECTKVCEAINEAYLLIPAVCGPERYEKNQHEVYNG